MAEQNSTDNNQGQAREVEPYPCSSKRPWNEIPLGTGEQGEVIRDVSVAPHSLITGSPGGGKSLIQSLNLSSTVFNMLISGMSWEST